MLSETEELPIQINADLVSKYSKDLLVKHFKFLAHTFKRDYQKYFPLKITDESDLLYLIHLSRSLEALKDCVGFTDHIKEYKNDIDSTYLVTTLASYLLSRKSKLTLEPVSANISKKADILAIIDNQEVYFECKNPKTDILAPIVKEHEKFYEELHTSIFKPCDVFITYNELDDKQIQDLKDFLKKKIPFITGEGEILNRNGVKVEIINVRDKFTDIGSVKLSMLLENYMEKALMPTTLINRNGVALGFTKNNVNAYKNIESQIKNSKNKVSKDKPLIAVINSEGLPGKFSDNVSFVNTLFNETKNTSFTGILFIRWQYSFEKLIEYEFTYINNPFARNQLSGISQLFTSNMTY